MEERKAPENGQIYTHFKGNKYKIICIGEHTETKEKMVVYKPINDEHIFIRPYDMFMSKTDKKKYPNATQEYRFELDKQITGWNSIVQSLSNSSYGD